MLDFRKQFQEIIEQSYIPFNIDKTATSDVWSNIYKVVLPNIPKNLFRYRRIDDKGYTIESLNLELFPYAMQECFRISMIHIYI